MNTLGPHDVIWINLKVLSRLPPYHRINAQNELFYIEPYHWFGGIWRFFRGDNRHWTIKRIDDLIQKARTICQAQNEKPKIKKAMMEHLRACTAGLNNLKETYAKDVTTTASIDRILDKVEKLVV